MNFAEFQALRSRLLAERPALLDLAETNLYRSLARLVPDSAPPTDGTVHRCHLASQWTALLGLPEEASRRAFVTGGVRDGLDTLFRHLAGKPCLLWLPEDNYPVYHELATAHGHRPKTFPTLPVAQWPEETPPVDAEQEWLLVTHPLKPRGRSVDNQDTESLLRWLATDERRRVLLDTVYRLEPRFDDLTLRLLATKQAIVLHSLTKGWLHPRCFGVVLMPERDASVWNPVFREKPPPQSNLATARHLMSRHADLPEKVAQALGAAQQDLFEAIRNLPCEVMEVDPASYFVPVACRWDALLDQGILGLPASVFGSPCDDLTLLSSLTFAT